jgi:hypothetical protein
VTALCPILIGWTAAIDVVDHAIGTLRTGAAFFGAPAGAGQRVQTTGISIYRIANGKIVEHWANMDFLGVLAQLGVIPMPDRPEPHLGMLAPRSN